MDWERTGIGPPGSQQAEQELRDRLATSPSDLVTMHNLSVELRMLGRVEEALALADAAWHGGLHLPETATTRGHDLVDLGRHAEAEECYRQALAVDPLHVGAHEALATLLPQLGDGERAFSSFDEALQRAPDSVPLWTSALTTTNAQRRFDLLERWSQTALRRFGEDPVLGGFLACAQIGLGRAAEARETIAAALVRQPGYAVGQVIAARIALALGDFDGAEGAAAQAVRLNPRDQLGWTLLSTAWRLLDDPREHWLCRYDELVMPIMIELPEGIEAALTARHRTAFNPAEQSLRGGTQTAGSLFHSAEPLVIKLARRLHQAIEVRLAELPSEQDHPFLSRNTGAIAFSASWSVRLADQGFHVGHMHPAGWLSSALYIAIPECVGAGSGEGVLTFGVPDAALGLDLKPRRVVEPKVGQLVLFPSYLWHGTTPFRSGTPRLTVAFDALPVDNTAPQG